MLGTDINLAPYESDTTADTAYAVGELFMLNGKLHRATAIIAIGETFTVGTNCEIVNASEVFARDVQVNGTSILSNGVANVPKMSVSNLGVASINTTRGIDISTDGALKTACAQLNEIKTGTNFYKPIVPSTTDASAFYGLAKAAGVDMASSSNPVGTYTAQAKAAIWNMLGLDGSAFVNSEWELIREDTVTHATSELLYITTDDNGQPFELTDIRMLIEIPPQENDFVITEYATISTYWGTNKVGFVGIGNSIYTITDHTARYAMLVEVEWQKGMSKMTGMQLQKVTGRTNVQAGLYYNTTASNREFIIGDNAFDKIRIPAFTGTLNYRLYGKRKRAALDSPVINVSGSTPSITALTGHRYVCGEVSTLDITLPVSGCFDVTFESGSTPTVLSATGVTWPDWFDATALEANRTYELNICDGRGAVMSWT